MVGVVTVADNDKVIFYQNARDAICVNPLNGEIVWKFTRVPEDNFSAFRLANITKWNNILIAKPSSYHMYGVDINTGNTIWTNPTTATMPFTIRIAMDKVWYGSGGVNCFDAKTGQTLINGWRYQNKGSWMNVG